MDNKKTAPKTKLINFRISEEEAERWDRAFKISGKSKTEICRKALDSHAAKIAKGSQ
jgi:uncharacterized protein (DUF1778 family)